MNTPTLAKSKYLPSLHFYTAIPVKPILEIPHAGHLLQCADNSTDNKNHQKIVIKENDKKQEKEKIEIYHIYL